MRKLSLSEFAQKAKIIHGDRYSYTNITYLKKRTYIDIVCKIHGTFRQLGCNHLAGNGCPHCHKELMNQNKFINISSQIHNNFYDYSLVCYKKVSQKVSIICPIHGEFKQTPGHHMYKKQGCPKCNRVFTKESWLHKAYKRKEALLYIIRCFNNQEEFIKIGITYKNLYKRFYNKKVMPYEFEILKEIKGSPDVIWDKEKELHIKYLKFKYTPKIKFSGETECFSKEIIQFL